jgi:hypothetical protein
MFVLREIGEASCKRLGLEAKIDEPGARNLRCGAQVSDVDLVDDLLRELPRIRLRLLGEDHGDVRLVVAEARIVGRHHLRISVGKIGQRSAETSGKKRGDGFH